MNVAEQPDDIPFSDEGYAAGGAAVLVATASAEAVGERTTEQRVSTHLPSVFGPGLCRHGRQLLGGQLLERSSVSLQPRLESQSDFVELR
jgi:hypothetical protein